MFRIVLVPVIACIYLFTDLPEAFGADVSGEHIAVSMTALLVLILFAIASFTDYLDGHIARKHNLITSFGKFIDPIADKLLVNTMFILFAVDGVVPAVFVLIMAGYDCGWTAYECQCQGQGGCCRYDGQGENGAADVRHHLSAVEQPAVCVCIPSCR